MNNSTRTDRGIMSKATKGVVAGALGIGLLAGGTTFALWNDDATLNGGKITAGNLDIEAVSDTRSWNDVSDGVKASDANVIDPATFRIVPGDTIQLSQDVKFELEGDNITADLTAKVPGLEGKLADHGLTLTYSLWEGGNRIASSPLGDSITVGPFNAPKAESGTYTIKANVHFEDRDNQERIGAEEAAWLGSIQFTLQQTN